MNINVRSKKGTAFVMGLSLMALTACNQSELSFSSARQGIKSENLADGDSWKATLVPIGAGSASGMATMKVEGNNFVVEIETSGLSEGTHSQSIRSGTCPIDATDMASAGESIISLDGDLSSEEAGSDAYPTSDVTGNYLYSESTDMSVVTAELAGKIVIVYGTSGTDTTSPVLCGVIEKQEALPVPQTGGGEQDQGQQDQGQQPQQQQQQHQNQTEVSMPETVEEPTAANESTLE